MPHFARLISFLLVMAAAPAAAGQSTSFFIDLPGDGIAASHNGALALAAGPPGIALLTEERVKHGLAILMKVRNDAGEVIGFASELESFPAKGDMLHQDITWNTAWTLVIPGQGMLFLHETEHSGELGPKVVNPTMASGEPWQGSWHTQTTNGPRADGLGEVIGGTGAFKGAKGSFAESITLTQYTKEGLLFGKLELRITWETPPQ